ncbi:MAG TPA: mechanosensitive ion channel family protein [Clostridia bacterium]|nr:mechanosensitive ion channel family protein [Clostridia bacterium]
MGFLDRMSTYIPLLAGASNPLLGLLVKLAVIVVGAQILIYAVNLSLAKVIKKTTMKLGRDARRIDNVVAILRSVIKYTAYFVAGLMILDALGIDTKALLAGAGIAGLAVGFGAQSLVKDVVTGLFLLLEDQFAVGDHVQMAGVEGIVEGVGIRVTQVRDFSGALHTIPNGSISTTTNWSRGNMRAMVEVSIAYEEDVNKAIAVLKEMCEAMTKDLPSIREGPDVLGVSRLGESDMGILLLAKVAPGEQWAVERELRKRAKEALEAAGIEVPYPRRVIMYGPKPKDKDSQIAEHLIKVKERGEDAGAEKHV